MKMRPFVILCATAVVAAGAFSPGASTAQAVNVTPTLGQAPAPKPPIPLKVDVVLSRFQGDKKIASLPYTMWVRAGERTGGVAPTNLRMGVDVPVGTVSATKPNTSGTNPTTTTTTGPDYRHVGTSIDVWAHVQDDGRYDVTLRLNDSSIFTADQEGRGAIKLADPMAFRTFSTSNTLTMRDGQTLQFAVATDKITGETIKVEVTINTVK
jgi:hypothetical protein